MDRAPYATFVVELLLGEHGSVRRTRVVHVQTGLEQRWPGWDGQRLVSLILGRTGPSQAGGTPVGNESAGGRPT